MIGDRVWEDTNGNGQQDAGEAGIAGVTVVLKDAQGNPVATTTTDGSGNYSFTVDPGTYVVSVATPTGYSVTTPNQGSDTTDSDVNPAGNSGHVTFVAGEINPTVDAGLYRAAALGDRVWLDTNGTEYTGDTVIIATGASAKYLGLESEKKFMGFGVSACATCDGFFFRNLRVAVVGGGDTAMEEANYLTRHASEVLVIHRREGFRASKIMLERAQKNPKIKFALNSVIDEIVGTDEGGKKAVTGIKLKNVKTGEVKLHECEGVFMAIGHQPNTQIFNGMLDMDNVGYLITKKTSSKTNIEGVFACGDAQDSVYRQAVTAAGTGCMAAIDAERYLESLEC